MNNPYGDRAPLIPFVPLCEPNPTDFTLITLIRSDSLPLSGLSLPRLRDHGSVAKPPVRSRRIPFDPDPKNPAPLNSLRAFVPLCEPNPTDFTLIALIEAPTSMQLALLRPIKGAVAGCIHSDPPLLSGLRRAFRGRCGGRCWRRFWKGRWSRKKASLKGAAAWCIHSMHNAEALLGSSRMHCAKAHVQARSAYCTEAGASTARCMECTAQKRTPKTRSGNSIAAGAAIRSLKLAAILLTLSLRPPPLPKTCGFCFDRFDLLGPASSFSGLRSRQASLHAPAS
jgi:hypothetical protein